MPKTNLSSRIKIAFLNIMQAFGSAASQMASNAKLRVQEINLESRRHEILTKFSLQAFEMWHNGVKLPKELSDMFKEISEIDDKLSILRAQKYAKVNVECEVIDPESGEAIPAECSVDVPADTEPAAQPVPEEPKAEPADEPAEVSAEEPKKPKASVKRKAKTAKAKIEE